MSQSKTTYTRLLAGVSIAALVMTPAFAQEVGDAESEDSARRLDPITVTATKRETSLEDTAASISVITGDSIDDRSIIAITELFDVIPGVTFSEPPGGLPSPTIRGIGTSTANQAFEQSVGLFQDGVFKPRSSQYTNALFDVERIEVVRGGQGVIFGKNTSVGAISVISRKPGDVFAGDVSASYEPVFDSFSAGATVDIPVSDELKFRFGGEFSRAGGFVENLQTGEDDAERDSWIIRGIGEYDPAGPFSASFLGQYSELESTGAFFQNVAIFDDPASQGIAGLFGFPEPVPFERNTNGSTRTFLDGTTTPPEGNQTESYDLALTLGYDLGDAGQITSITSYSEFDYLNVFDALGTIQTTPSPPFPPIVAFTQNFDESFSQFTQELRHNFETDRFRLTSGIFFQLQDFDFSSTTPITNFFIPPTSPSPLAGGNINGTTQDLFDQDLWAASIFAQAGYDITERLSVEAGIRVSREEKDGTLSDGNIVNLLGLTPAAPPNFAAPGTSILPFVVTTTELDDDVDDTSVDGSITLSYDITDDILAFTSFSQGTKSGGFTNSATVGVPFTFEEEVARAGEVGIKGGFADGAGYFSLTGFYTDIENFQDSVFDPLGGALMTGAFVTVAFDAENYGLEAEARYKLTEDIVLGGSISLLDAESSATGATLARAPTFTSSWTVDFDRDVTQNFALQAGGLLVTNSGQLHRQTPIGAPPLPINDPIESGAFQLLDLYAGVRHLQSGTQFRVEVKNVTDEEYLTFGFPQPLLNSGINGAFNRPRTVTLGVRIPFGG